MTRTWSIRQLRRPHLIFAESERSQEITDLDNLIFREVTRPSRTKRERFAFHGDRPIPSMRLVDFAKASEQRTHVVPLDVVVQWVTEELLGSYAVVVIQLDRHSQPPQGPRCSALSSTLPLLGPHVKERDELDVLGHRKQIEDL